MSDSFTCLPWGGCPIHSMRAPGLVRNEAMANKKMWRSGRSGLTIIAWFHDIGPLKWDPARCRPLKQLGSNGKGNKKSSKGAEPRNQEGQVCALHGRAACATLGKHKTILHNPPNIVVSMSFPLSQVALRLMFLSHWAVCRCACQIPSRIRGNC